MKFRVGDKVKITGGKDKGKEGKIKQVLPKKDRVVVEGVNKYKRHLKPRQTGGSGQVIERERPLPAAKIAIVCPKCNKLTRVGYIVDKRKNKQRICKKCKGLLTVAAKAKK